MKMLKATTQPQTTRFYGKTNRGEFAWFVIFMGCLGLGVIFIIVQSLLEYPQQMKMFSVIIVTIGIFLMTSFILYWGFTMRWEFKDGGKNAVADFWKKYWGGKVPRLVDIRVVQPTVEDYLRQRGMYPEDLKLGELGEMYVQFKKEFGDERYVLFDFYRGIMHVDVYVYIPLRQFKKLERILEDTRYKIIKKDGKTVLKYEDGEEIELNDEDYEALKFLEILLKTQAENIKYILDLKIGLKTGRIGLREYIIDAYRFKFWDKKR